MPRRKIAFRSLAEITIATPGDGVPLSLTSLPVENVLIETDSANVGAVYVAGSEADVEASLGSRLAPDGAITLDVSSYDGDNTLSYLDLAEIWLAGTNAGDKVRVSYLAVEEVMLNAPGG